MGRKLFLITTIIIIVGLIANYFTTNDLETYKTYDIGNDDEEIISCFDYDESVYSNYLCVEDFLNHKMIEEPTDEPVVLSTRVYENEDGSLYVSFRTSFIDSRIDFIPDWFSEFSNPAYISSIVCDKENEVICRGRGGITAMNGMNREQAIEVFNNDIENWEYEDIIYYNENGVIVFPKDNENNEKYLSLISINGESMDEFWDEVNKGISDGEIKVVE